MPTWLPKGFARKEFRRLSKILYDRGTIAAGDSGTLALYCQAMHQMAQASQQLEAEGLTVVQMTREGHEVLKQHPAVAVRDSAARDVKACAVQLGLTPISRTRASELGGDEEPRGGARHLSRIA